MKLDLRRDAIAGVWEFSNAQVAVRSHGDIALLRRLVGDALRSIAPRSTFLVQLDGLVLEPRFAKAYGTLVKEFVAPAGHRVLRYGGSLLATTGMRAAAIGGGFASQVFRTREDALYALKYLPPSETKLAPASPPPRASWLPRLGAAGQGA